MSFLRSVFSCILLWFLLKIYRFYLDLGPHKPDVDLGAKFADTPDNLGLDLLRGYQDFLNIVLATYRGK